MALQGSEQVLACSPFLQGLDRRHPDWLPSLAEEGRLDGNRPPEADVLASTIAEHGLDAGLRRFRNREMLRITWREFTADATLMQTLGDLTRLAELCLQAALDAHSAALRERFGTPRDEDGNAQHLVVLGLGKLGGGELNLSSDIDLILCYPNTAECDGRRGLSGEQFFTRLSRAVIASLSEPTEDGFCFRVDTRLRPFGEAGPLVCSFGALEQYYQREGRDWERYALVKARPVAGDRDAGMALLADLTPFVYRRYIDYGAVEALRDMLDAIRADAARRDREDDVKRGPGGIREVEFLVQCVQLLRGGREPALRTPALQEALSAIGSLELMPPERIAGLRDCYGFLRRLENAIQGLHDRQEHRLPTDTDDRGRIVRVMGAEDEADLAQRLATVRRQVSEALDDSFPRRAGAPAVPGRWREGLATRTGEPWADFADRLGRMALSDRAGQRLDRFMPLLLETLEELAPPDDALQDVLGLVLAVCRRSAYLALLVQNPQALRRMVNLFVASDWVADTVIRHPALLDELIDPALGRDLPDRAELERTARRFIQRPGEEEEAINALNYLKRAQSLRVAVAELEGVIESTEAERRLTELAEVLLGQCLDLAERLLAERHGHPPGGRLVVIGYGSLGAGDMSYGSDLDLVFLYPAGAGDSDGRKPLAAETWYTRLVRRILAWATTVSPSGRLYDVDTRLRPNGRSGLLVSSLDAFGRYQRQDAWVWEWQALTRARPVAGDEHLARRFEEIRLEVLSMPRGDTDLRSEVTGMRARMREQISGGDPCKHGPGGLLDIDFLAQLGILERAADDADLRGPTDTRSQLTALGDAGWLTPGEARELVDTHRALTRTRHLNALCRGEPLPPPDTTRALEICTRHGVMEPVGAIESG